MAASFEAYAEALDHWETQALQYPDLLRIPTSLLESADEKDQKKVARMRRNYAFDRARCFLPVAAATNMMLVMSARGWVQLCQNLLSHALPEAIALGTKIRDELALAAPRLIKHAEAKISIRDGMEAEFGRLTRLCRLMHADAEALAARTVADDPDLELLLAPDYVEGDIEWALQFHDNRYAWLGSDLQRTAVRFRWNGVAMAEIRDLNRHRTGAKWCPLVPLGFYGAEEQQPEPGPALERLMQEADRWTRRSRELLATGDPSYLYWTHLGSQYYFEHTTTADKFIYEAELRTGLGAHYRYAKHLRDMLAQWYDHFPGTRGLVLEGTAEPE
jgi:hypothetical protein